MVYARRALDVRGGGGRGRVVWVSRCVCAPGAGETKTSCVSVSKC
jgi:hypothetical protein